MGYLKSPPTPRDLSKMNTKFQAVVFYMVFTSIGPKDSANGRDEIGQKVYLENYSLKSLFFKTIYWEQNVH
jgi:hypothetical protein